MATNRGWLRLFVVVTLGVWGSVSAQMPDTFVPRSGNQVLLEVSPSASTELAALRELREQLSEQPDDADRALALARRAIEAGRRLDDPRLFGQAQAALAPWWDQAEPPTEIAVLRATILQHRHEFAAALRDLDTVLQRDPAHSQARLTRAVLHTVQGRYEAALGDCAIVGRRVGGLIGLACVATPASLQGAAERSYALLERIPDSMPVDDTLVWALTVRAELAERLGRPDDEIERHFEAAIAATQDQPDRYLHNAYADWLLDRGRAAEALRQAQFFADSDGSLLRAAQARVQLAASGDRAATERLRRDRAELAARFEAEQARGGAVHLREAAVFALHVEDDADRAIWLARDNFRIQKEPADARILLESARAAGAFEQARPAIAWYRDNQVTDVRLQTLVDEAERALEAGRST